MKSKKIATLACLSFALTSLGGCENGKKNFDVYWLDWNGSILELDRGVEKETMPEYNGKTPLKATDDAATYEFKGWDKEISTVQSEQKYTAVYEATPRKYKITWLNYDNNVLSEDTVEYGLKPEYKGSTPKKPSTLLTDFIFTGWDRTISPVKGDTIYKATFKESNFEPVYLSYFINKTKHEVTNTNPETLRKGSSISLTNATAKGYDFKGWYLDEECTIRIETGLTNLDHDLIVYGKFVPHVYKITYDNANGVFGEGEENVTSLTCETEPFELFKPTKIGYGFTKWQDNKGRTYTTLEDVCEDLSLHAVFEANKYTITLKYKDKSDEFVSIKYDQKVTLPVLEKKGYEFLGWYDFKTDAKFELSNYTLLEDTILYGKWGDPISYSISYDYGGGIVDGTEPENYTVDSFPDIIEPTRVGYDFDGWYLNNKPFLTFRDHTENLNLVAKWIPHNVTISYDYEGGTLQRLLTFKNGENEINKLISPFNGCGFELLNDTETSQFKGWKNEKGQFISFKNNVTVNSDTVLQASWEEIRPNAVAAKIGDEINFVSIGSGTNVFQFTSLYAQDVKFEFDAETFIVASLTSENKSPINGGKQSNYSKQFVLDSIHLEANKTYFLTIYSTGEGEHNIKIKTSSISDNSKSLSGQIFSTVYTINETSQKYDEMFIIPGIPVKEGKVFEGWKDEDGVLYSSDTVLKKEQITLHASWTNPIE